MQGENKTHYEVIIIGAGASGIGAAITLQRAGVPYLILQARNRIGGRLQSALIDGIQLDLGGCWVHCFNKNNLITKEIQRLGWQQRQQVDHQNAQHVDEVTGKNIPEKVIDKAQSLCQKFFQIAQKNASKSDHDLSIYQAGQNYYKNQIEKQDKEIKRAVDMLICEREQQQAASITQVSAKALDQGMESKKDFSPKQSYAALMKAIASDLKVELNTKVNEIQYSENKVKILCENKKIYTAKKVVCSLPLGVLKAGAVKFSPQLPKKHKTAIQKLGFGLMNKIIMSFEEPFWELKRNWISIACEEKGKYPAFYNFSRGNKYILCGFVTDKFAKKISQWSDQEIIKDVTLTLTKSFKGKKINVKEFKITRWNKDPLALGSYTYFHKNSSPENCRDLLGNINNTLWIVGEHCFSQYIGSAHGAFQTGVWASQQIMKKLK